MILDLPPRHPYRFEVRSSSSSHQAVGPPLTWRTWKVGCWAQGPQIPQHGPPHAKCYMYSTDQMQGIRQTRFDRILNAFSAADERIYC